MNVDFGFPRRAGDDHAVALCGQPFAEFALIDVVAQDQALGAVTKIEIGFGRIQAVQQALTSDSLTSGVPVQSRIEPLDRNSPMPVEQQYETLGTGIDDAGATQRVELLLSICPVRTSASSSVPAKQQGKFLHPGFVACSVSSSPATASITVSIVPGCGFGHGAARIVGAGPEARRTGRPAQAGVWSSQLSASPWKNCARIAPELPRAPSSAASATASAVTGMAVSRFVMQCRSRRPSRQD